MVWKMVPRGLLGRLLGLGVFSGGFFLLARGFVESNLPLGLLGGAMIPLGMWVMVTVHREGPDR